MRPCAVRKAGSTGRACTCCRPETWSAALQARTPRHTPRRGFRMAIATRSSLPKSRAIRSRTGQGAGGRASGVMRVAITTCSLPAILRMMAATCSALLPGPNTTSGKPVRSARQESSLASPSSTWRAAPPAQLEPLPAPPAREPCSALRPAPTRLFPFPPGTSGLPGRARGFVDLPSARRLRCGAPPNAGSPSSVRHRSDHVRGEAMVCCCVPTTAPDNCLSGTKEQRLGWAAHAQLQHRLMALGFRAIIFRT